MSSFGSSLINKSGRRIAPRAATKRRAPLSDAQHTVSNTTSVAADVVESIEPVASGTAVLQAQLAVQSQRQDAAAGGLSNGDALAVSDSAVGRPGASERHRQKRARLTETAAEEQGESAAPLFVPRTSPASALPDSRPSSNTRVTRSRTAISAALVTPPASQDESRDYSRIDVTNRSHDVVSNGVEQAPAHSISDANWVVTTQDQLRQKADASRRRRAQQEQSAEALTNSAALVAQEAAPSGSSRLANLQKRKKKKEAMWNIQTGMSVQEHGRAEPEIKVTGDADCGTADQGQEMEQTRSHQHNRASEALSDRNGAPRKVRRRAETPEEMENVTIVDSLVTMAELSTRERKYGKKSDRERKMRMIDWALVKTRRREEEIRMAAERGRHRNTAQSNADDDEDDGDLEDEETLDAALSRVAARNRARRRGTGIRIRVINGEHVIDERSQRVDRHALANEDLDALEEVEEEELTQRFNSHTYVNMKRRDPADRLPINDRWSNESTDKFYDCLRRFGTDFMIISKMFPGRTRRQIKAKFVREERLDLQRVHEALSKGVPAEGPGEEEERQTWDLDIYRESAGIELSQLLDPREVERELESVRKVRELAIEERRKETEEMKRQRRLAGEVSSDEEEEQQAQQPEQPEQQLKPAQQNKTVKSNQQLADEELEEVEEFG